VSAGAFLSGNLGNTRASFVLFEGDRVLARGAVSRSEDVSASLRDLLARAGRKPDLAGFAAVSPEADVSFEEALHSTTGLAPKRIGRDAPFGLEIRVRAPERVGEDRLAAARGALARWPEDLVVVDAGTAITVDAVLGSGAFLGGAIAPGRRLAARSLREGTSLLPLVEPDRVESAIGRDTEAAIRAGLDFGWAGLVDALVEAVRREFNAEARAVATGGDAPFLLERCRTIGAADPDLVHLGIRAICAP